MVSEITRSLHIEIPKNPLKGSGACFLWGPRGTGKTTFLKQHYPKAKYVDLLQSERLAEFSIHPNYFREEILSQNPETVIVDEVQKVPSLLDEIHWLLENTSAKFILCGSSARKLKRESKNLLGGRAVSYSLFPLTLHELDNFDLDHALNFGMLPRHYLDKNPQKLLKAYVNHYLKEEIIEESIVRRIPSFAKFLEIAAMMNGELLNYANVGREAGVSPATVRDYYQILEDTLLGHTLEPWKKRKDRRLIETAKFYFFDVGVVHSLHPEITQVVPGTDVYGDAFEHLLMEEVRAYLSYQDKDFPLSFWRTASGYEVDLIVGHFDLVLEFKSTQNVSSNHLKGLRALKEENKVKKALLISRMERARKTTDDIELISWKAFCKSLWRGELL